MIRKDFTLNKNALNLGAAVGILFSAFQLLAYTYDFTTNSGYTWGLFFLLVGVIVWGAKKYREMNDGYISYRQVLAFGTMLSFGASLVFGVTNYLYVEFVDPGYLELLMEQTELAFYETKAFSDAEIEKMMTRFRENTSAASNAMGQAAFYIFFGFIASLIIAYFVKNPKPMFEE